MARRFHSFETHPYEVRLYWQGQAGSECSSRCSQHKTLESAKKAAAKVAKQQAQAFNPEASAKVEERTFNHAPRRVVWTEYASSFASPDPGIRNLL